MAKENIEGTDQQIEDVTNPFEDVSIDKLTIISSDVAKLADILEHHVSQHVVHLIGKKNEEKFIEALEIKAVLYRFDECQRKLLKATRKRLDGERGDQSQQKSEKSLEKTCLSLGESLDVSKKKIESGLIDYQRLYPNNKPAVFIRAASSATIVVCTMGLLALYYPDEVHLEMKKTVVEVVGGSSLVLAFGGDAFAFVRGTKRHICKWMSKDVPCHIMVAKKLEESLAKNLGVQKATGPSRPKQNGVKLNAAGWSQDYNFL